MENLMTEVRVDTISDSGVGSFTLSFQRRVEFHPARKHFAGFGNGGCDGGDFKLETLNPSRSSDHSKPGSGQQAKKAEGLEFWENGLDPELSFGITFRRIGAGLENLGNTCFLNSVLQCLTYTEPLAAYLQSGKHQSSCHIAGFCALCAIQKHVSRALQAPGRILAPKDLVLNLRCISRNFRISRQEDAHEYMVNLLESMHKCCIPSGVPSESSNAYEKSLVHNIFGGRLRSQVKCMECSYCSNKFDPFLDLSLEIAKVDSVHKALNNFTTAELLDGGEKQYQCQKCKQKVRALKQLTVYKAPYVLTIHLKRFRAHDPGQKIDKKVQFGSTLDMKPFVSGSYEGDLKYTLYGVLVHHGWSTHSGHYYCFVRTSSGMWYSLDDNRVVQVNERSVLEQKAYMLFYVRDRKNVVPRKPIDVVQKVNLKADVNGNKTYSNVSQPPKEHPQSCPTQNGVHGVDSSAVARQKAAANGVLSKETHLKQASVQPGRELVECSVPKKDTLSEPYSSRAPLLKNSSEGLSVLITDQEKSSQPSVPCANSSGISHNTENNTTATTAHINNSKENGSSKNDLEVSLTTLPNCNGTQNSSNKLVNESSQKINLVSNSGASNITPRDSNDKKMEGISNTPLSGDCNDKWLEKTYPVKYRNEPRSEKQVEDNSNNVVACNSRTEKADDNGQAMRLELVELSTASVLKNESLHVMPSDGGPKSKLKKHSKGQIRNMAIGLKFFRASLGLRKKKHKKRKRHILDSKNCGKELLTERDCSPSDVGSSNSDNTNRITRSSSHSRKKAANGTAQKNVKPCNGYSSMNGIDGELRVRNNQNGVVLATDERLPKHCAIAPSASKNSRKDALQEGMSKLTRGLEETAIAQWDGIDLHTQNVESNGTESLSIGYVLDECDNDYDQGKRKKLRQNKHSFGGPNPFQEIAAKKTQMKKAKLSHTSSADQPFRI